MFSFLLQAKLAQFQSLQKQRRALDSTSDESLHRPSPTVPKSIPVILSAPQGTPLKPTWGEGGRDGGGKARTAPQSTKSAFSTFSASRGEFQQSCSINKSEQQQKTGWSDKTHPRSKEEEKKIKDEEEERGRSSSFENIYDGVDLSMYSPSMNDIDWLEFRRLVAEKAANEKDNTKTESDKHAKLDKELGIEERIKRFQHKVQESEPASTMATAVAAPGGGIQHRYQSSQVTTSSYSKHETYYQKSMTSSHETSSSSSKTFSSYDKNVSHQRSFSFDDKKPSQSTKVDDGDEGPRSPSWYVPKPSEKYDKKEGKDPKHSKYDAKSLIEEEKQKFEDYKRDYRRRLSERESTSGASGDEGLKDSKKEDTTQRRRVS